ncbi:MAG: UrcA family protein [Steroidobacteraceae bacterium]
MKSTQRRRRLASSLCSASLLALAASGYAQASIDTTVGMSVSSQRVQINDLNLASDEGWKTLLERLERAANNVCEQPGSRDLLRTYVHRRCVNDALTRALTQVRSPERSGALYDVAIDEQSARFEPVVPVPGPVAFDS